MTFFFTFGLWKTIGYFGMFMTTIIKIESIVGLRVMIYNQPINLHLQEYMECLDDGYQSAIL